MLDFSCVFSKGRAMKIVVFFAVAISCLASPAWAQVANQSPQSIPRQTPQQVPQNIPRQSPQQVPGVPRQNPQRFPVKEPVSHPSPQPLQSVVVAQEGGFTYQAHPSSFKKAQAGINNMGSLPVQVSGNGQVKHYIYHVQQSDCKQGKGQMIVTDDKQNLVSPMEFNLSTNTASNKVALFACQSLAR